jgi:TolA-binding protein
LSEDAWFWLAVCQARIPRPAEARATLAAFIARFPHSPRVGEAADMLGWLLIDSGDLDGAERAFATAALRAGAGVRHSAKEGLRAVQVRRRAIDEEMPRP